MLSVDHIQRTDCERYIRVNQTLLTGRYYEETGTLKFRLDELVSNAGALRNRNKRWCYEPYDLILAYVDGQLAGYCVYITGRRPGVELYVCPRYRRQGVATALVKAVRKHTRCKVLHAKPGYPGSTEFFRSQHIFIENNDAVYGIMRQLGGANYNHLPPDQFIKLYRHALKRYKLKLHHRVRKEYGTQAS